MLPCHSRISNSGGAPPTYPGSDLPRNGRTRSPVGQAPMPDNERAITTTLETRSLRSTSYKDGGQRVLRLGQTHASPASDSRHAGKGKFFDAVKVASVLM